MKPLVVELVMDRDGHLSHECRPKLLCIRRVPVSTLEKAMVLVASAMLRATVAPTTSFLPVFLFRHGDTPYFIDLPPCYSCE